MQLNLILGVAIIVGTIFQIVGCIRVYREFSSVKFRSRGFIYFIIGLGIELVAYIIDKNIDYMRLSF